MVIAAFQNIIKEYNGEGLFEPITFQITSRDSIALIGPNGTGKSTIVKMLIGELHQDAGQIVIGKEFKIGYLSQSVISDMNNTLYSEACNVFSNLIQMNQNLEKISEELTVNYTDEKMKQYSVLEENFSKLGGYDYKYKIEMMLSKFGFTKDDYQRVISSFSGGERMKVAFVKLLLINPDLLVLDEPTNHLDIDTIEWLEEYLKSYQGAILFVSHDRYFINALAKKVFELDQKHLEVYAGNYDAYAKEKQVRYLQRLEMYKRQQKEAEKLEWFIKFYMPKPRFASRAHDREKKLARLETKMIDKPIVTRNKVNMNLGGYTRKGKHLVEVKDVDIGYDKPLIKGINFTLYGGDKLAIMGQNGAGKTTFVKCLLNQLNPLSGEVKFLTELKVGYLRQDGINLSSPLSIFDYIKDKFPKMLDQEIYDHLGNYNFSYEDDKKIIDNLSGGERMRVVFAELVLHNYNLLVLDEPTNHLDMMTKEELLEALQEYEGTLIIVSHDRYFVDNLCSRLVYFEDGQSYVYEGRYSEFKLDVLDSVLEKKEEELLLEKEAQKKEQTQKTKYVHVHQEKPRPRFAKNKIEEKMARLEKSLTKIKEDMDKPENYSNIQTMKELEEQQVQQEKEYEELLEMLGLYEE